MRSERVAKSHQILHLIRAQTAKTAKFRATIAFCSPSLLPVFSSQRAVTIFLINDLVAVESPALRFLGKVAWANSGQVALFIFV
jgi:hypothetical protein